MKSIWVIGLFGVMMALSIGVRADEPVIMVGSQGHIMTGKDVLATCGKFQVSAYELNKDTPCWTGTADNAGKIQYATGFGPNSDWLCKTSIYKYDITFPSPPTNTEVCQAGLIIINENVRNVRSQISVTACTGTIGFGVGGNDFIWAGNCKKQ